METVSGPAARAVAPKIADTDIGGGANARAIVNGMSRFLRPMNYLGVPALVVPVAHSAEGLPIGLQLVGRPFGDETLIALGCALQQVSDEHLRVPQLL